MSLRTAVGGVLVGVLTAGTVTLAAAAPEYRIQPGDLLEIVASVGMEDFTPPGKVTVGPDGRFAYPIAEEVEAAGKTRLEVAAAIKRALQRLYRTVEVTVNVAAYHAREVFVFGEVGHAGAVPLTDRDEIEVRQALAAAGGYTEEAAGVTLYRGGEAPRRFAPEELATQAQPVMMQPNDMLVVARRQPLMMVGEVVRPGPVTPPPQGRLTDALALAGGLGPQADAQHAVLVSRANQTTVVDLQAVLANPEASVNLPIADYHTLVVPPRRAVAVVGEVKTPGLYPVGPAMRLTDVVALAGGLTTLAATSATAVDEAGQVRTVDLTAALTRPGSEADPPVAGLRTLVIGRELRQVTVIGEVNKPNVFPLEAASIALSAALALAGGPTPMGDLRQVAIGYPDGRRQVMDATALVGRLPGTGPVTDPRLPSGVVVAVPLRQARVIVLGAVQRAGAYVFAEGDTVIDAIALAGGFVEREAAKRHVYLLRRVEDRVEVREIDLKTGLRGGSGLFAGALADRDVVMVERSNKINWPVVASTIFGIAEIIRVTR